jgi:hypothetical protein
MRTLSYQHIGGNEFSGEMVIREGNFKLITKALAVSTLSSDYENILIMRGSNGQLIFRKSPTGEATRGSLYFDDPDYYSTTWVCKAYRY